MNLARTLSFALLGLLPLGLAAESHRTPFNLRTDFMLNTEYYVKDGFVTRQSVETAQSDTSHFQAAWVRTLHPSFAWVVQDNKSDCEQVAFRLIVADNARDAKSCRGNVYDSKMITSPVSSGFIPQDLRLMPDKAYYWRVLVSTNRDSRGKWSAVKLFRTFYTLDDNATSYEPLVKTRQKAGITKVLEGGSTVADFGQDAFAQPMLIVNAKQKTKIRVFIGEKLNSSGHVDMNPGGTIRAAKYELNVKKGKHAYKINLRHDKRNTGKDAIKIPDFIGEITPFRYCETVDSGGNAKVTAFLRDAVSYQLDENASHFSSDNDTLNRIFDFCKYSLRATSALGYFVDGDRERIPYEADALISMLGTYNTFGEYCMARRTLRHLLAHPTWPTEWNLQTVALAFGDYFHTGDTRLASHEFELLEAHTLSALECDNSLISSCTGLQTPEFLKSINMNGKLKDITDWPDYGAGLNEPKGGERDGFVMTDFNAVVNAWHYKTLSEMAQLSRAVTKPDKAAYYKKKSDEFRKIYNQNFYDASRKCYVDAPGCAHASSHANFYALALGLCDAQHSAAVANYVISRGMACSVFGSQFLLDALFLNGHAAEAIDMIKSDRKRSWMNMLRSGATITMEDWDAKFKPNLDWNHAWATAPANLLMRRVLGITPTTPAYSKFTVRPRLGKLEHAEGWVTTMSGRISVSVKTQGKQVEVTLVVPANTKAVLNIDEISTSLTNAKLLRAVMDGKSLSPNSGENSSKNFSCGSGKHTYEFTYL